jgi:hypothetical protein
VPEGTAALRCPLSISAGTSIIDVRLNCPPEVTLHRLRRSGAP